MNPREFAHLSQDQMHNPSPLQTTNRFTKNSVQKDDSYIDRESGDSGEMFDDVDEGVNNNHGEATIGN